MLIIVDSISGVDRPIYDVVGVIGCTSSSQSVKTSTLLGVNKIPQISPTSTSNELSNKLQYEYFSRTGQHSVWYCVSFSNNTATRGPSLL